MPGVRVADSDVLTPSTAGAFPVHRLAEGIELLGEYKDSAYQEPKYLVQRADGQAMQLPGLLYRVACSLDGTRDDGEVAAQVGAELEQHLTAEQVSFLVEERLRPVGLIAPDRGSQRTAEDGTTVAPTPTPAPVRSDPLLALRYRVGVISAGVAWRIAGFFRVLFVRPVWIGLLTAFVVTDLWIVAQGDVVGRMVAGVRDIALHPTLILAILGLGIVASAVHECGHVTACRYGGARPGDIGVGLYLVWPAFYSTVTDSYRLDRVGRLRTDLGGVYFNAVFMLGLGLVYIGTGEPWLLLALIGKHVETAWQFLPLLRMDGYYVLADLLGVPDLFGYVRPVLGSLLPWRPAHPLMRQLKPRARRLVLLWVVVVVPVLTLYLVAFLIAVPRLLPAAWEATLEYLRRLDAAARTGDVAVTTLGVFQLLLLALPWIGVGLILWSLAGLLHRVLAARWRWARMSVAGQPAVRRAVALTALGALGALLVARVAAVASAHPATTGEARFVAGALAAVRGIDGGPTVGPGEWPAREQLVGYAALTGAFDRHATVLTGGREPAVVASGVVVICVLVLVATRRLRPLAVAVPLAATVAMGPAVTALATAGPSLLGAAWAAGGALTVALVRRRPAMLLGAFAIAVGVVTEPLLAVPLAAGLAAVLTHGQPGTGRPRRSVAPVPANGTAAHPAHPVTGRRYTTVRGRSGMADPAVWLAMALLLAVGAFGAFGAVPAGRSRDLSLDGSERTVLLLAVGLVVVVGLVVRWLRPHAMAAATLVVLAVLPWRGAEGALLLAVVAAAGLAALVTDALARGRPEERPHPLLRVAVAVPAVVVIVVGGLFLPVAAGGLPHRELAAWITGPASTGGTVAVPVRLWGDLLRDGVPEDRLVLTTAPDAAAAIWTVEVGDVGGVTGAAAGFGAGATSLTVLPLPPAEMRHRMAAVERHAAEAAAGRHAAGPAVVAQQRLGRLLASSPRLLAEPDVLTALRNGSVDARVLVVLAGLTVEHTVEVAAVPTGSGEDPGAGPRHEIVVTRLDGRSADRPEVVAVLTEWLQAQPTPFAPSVVTAGPSGVSVGWSPPAPVPATGW
ncbi:hypothetical protein [Blastococcus colisei]|uniref:hypothetical protein n=1 Tax=Blastococcus colisei TaxID=1564162 RepID=UPI001154EC24|nr:hypothetical protein [Blastococcus colisei]